MSWPPSARGAVVFALFEPVEPLFWPFILRFAPSVAEFEPAAP